MFASSRLAPKATCLVRPVSKVGRRGFAQVPLTEPLPNLKTQDSVPLTTPQLKSTTLSNGVKVVTVDSKQPVSSVTVLVNAGARNENADNTGASFFLKRLGFKSNKNVTSLRLIRTLELLGANYEVGVGREQLVYSSELPTDQVHEVVPLLSSVLQPLLREYEIRDETPLLESEIASFESSPKDLTLELVHQTAYRHKTLGQSLYTPHYNVHNLDTQSLASYVDNNFTADNVVVVASGGIDHESFVNLVNQHFANVRQSKSQPKQAAKYLGGETRVPGDFATHLALAFEGAAANTKESHALNVLKNVLGGSKKGDFAPSIGQGVSGRLSRNVVEANSGWVQEASAFNFGYSDSGVFGVLAVANRGNVANLVNVIGKELKNALEVSEQEVQKAKKMYKSQLLFANQSRKNLSEFLGQQALSGKVSFPSEVAEGVEGVSVADVKNAAKKMLGSKPTLVVLGDVYNTPTLEDVQASLK